jgi:hypothetical protein
MRKLDRLLMGILLPVSEGLSAQNAKVSTSHRDPILNVNTHSPSYALSSLGEGPPMLFYQIICYYT